jgi:hypothetical protein
MGGEACKKRVKYRSPWVGEICNKWLYRPSLDGRNAEYLYRKSSMLILCRILCSSYFFEMKCKRDCFNIYITFPFASIYIWNMIASYLKTYLSGMALSFFFLFFLIIIFLTCPHKRKSVI